MGFLEKLAWLIALVKWLDTPSVRPWVGAVAAVLAALTIETKGWIKSPSKGLVRALRVALVWFLIVWFVRQVGGRGDGGPGDGGKGAEKPDEGAKVQLQSASPTGTVTIVPGKMPTGLPDNTFLVVSFVPSVGNENRGQDFACDLVRKGDGSRFQIRAGGMQEFDKLLVGELRKIKLPDDVSSPVIKIMRMPDPGENSVRHICEKIIAVFPKATFVLD